MDFLFSLLEIFPLPVFEPVRVAALEVGAVFPVVLSEAVVQPVFPGAFINEKTRLVVVHAFAVELALLKVADVLLSSFELKLAVAAEEIVFEFEGAFVFEVFSGKCSVLPGVMRVLAFISKERGDFFALSVHAAVVELAQIIMLRGEDKDSFNVREVVFEVAVVPLLIGGLELAVALFEPVLDVASVLLLCFLK